MYPPENEVDNDAMPPLLPNEYGRGDESEDKEADTPMKQRRWVIQPEEIPLAVRNVYNIFPRDQTDYVKEKVNISISFTQVGNNLNTDELHFLQNEGTKHSEQTFDYSTVIEYEFTQYSLKSGLKELGAKGETAIKEEMSQLHKRDAFCHK